MNWDAIGAVAEVVGAIAVIVSLVYLALQIKAQNKQAKLAANHGMFRELRSASQNVGDLAAIFVRANNDYQSITEEEAIRLVVYTTNLIRAWESAFLEYQEGNLDARVWESLSKDYGQMMGASSIAHVWNLRKRNYDAAFQEYVDGIQTSKYVVK